MKPTKICQQCGRSFEFRKKWEKNWDEVKYCIDRCRQSSKGQGKKRISDYKSQIIVLLESRAHSSTIRPSDILDTVDKQNKEKLEEVRQAARLLADENKIEISQSGQVVDPRFFLGPIRLKLKK